MLYLVLFFLLLLLYTYFGYLILIIILGRLRNKKINKDDITPSVTFMIAAFNEEKDIAEKIENTLKIDYPQDKFQIVIVSDGSTDKTDEIVKSYGEKGVELIRVEGRVGKTEARNQAVEQVNSDIIVFSDATTDYSQESVKKLVRNFNDPEVGMVSGHLKYVDPKSTQIGLGQKLFWQYETIIKKSQTLFGTLTGSIGCITAFRRELYTALPSNVIEDFTGPLFIIQKGYRVVFEENAVCYEETTKKTKNEWSMRVRVIRGGLTGLLFAKKVLNPIKFPHASFQLISHKVLRWLVPVFLILLLASSTLYFLVDPSCMIGMVILLGQLLFYMIAALAFFLEKMGKHPSLLGIPLYFTVVNLAALVALYKTMTSPLAATWETDRS